MICSFNETRSYLTHLFVYVDEADTKIKQYREVLKHYDVPHEIGPHKFQCQVFNYAALIKYPKMKYYHEVNDDHIFRTKDWDVKMKSAIEDNGGWGIACGVTENLPTAVMFSGNIIRTLGYWMYPAFHHSHVDLYTKDLCDEADLKIDLPDVLIEHMHAIFGKGPKDENYWWVTSKEQSEQGEAAYKDWVMNKKAIDIDKIKKARGI
jgi:hypothetical protein